MAVILPQSMQEDIQSSLPITPNNGNPAGAYNMASAAPQQQQVPNDPYAWLQPSPYMELVNEVISNGKSAIEVMAMSSLFTPSIDSKGFNILVKDGNYKMQPVDEYGLAIPSDEGPTYEWELPSGYDGMPQYSPILPGE